MMHNVASGSNKKTVGVVVLIYLFTNRPIDQIKTHKTEEPQLIYSRQGKVYTGFRGELQ